MSTPEFVALRCPQCGASLGEGLVCAYCDTRSERVSAANKPRVSVDGEHQDLHVGGIIFDRRVGLDDGQLEAIAGQVAGAMAGEPGSPDKHFLAFTLPLPPKSGRPPALYVEAHRVDSGGIKVLFIADYIPELHSRLHAKDRVLNFPSERR